jgi:hypothetical protein
VRARIQIPEMPRYIESVLMDGLVRKLKDEYGDPPPALLVQPDDKPAQKAPAAEDGDGEKGGAAQTTGKPLADDEQDPEAQDEGDLEVTEDDLDRANGEK